MRFLILALTGLCLTVTPLGESLAVTPPGDEAPIAHKAIEIIVMEAEGCIYCGVFRRTVLPVFEASERGKSMPVRFLDINDIETAALTLDGPINMLPTFVIVDKRREIGRIPGFVGRDTFMQSIDYVLSTHGLD